MKLVISVVALSLVLASSGYAQDTVQVKAGWNNIGAITAGAATEVLCTDPPGIIVSAIYGYTPGVGYESADTLEKGLGYWVKVSSDGLIVFNGSCGGGGDTCSVSSVTYEGGPYPTVQIGSQCWLAKNLNVGSMVTGVTEQTNNSTLEKYCYDNNEANCTTYGGLYQWNEAMQYVTTPGTQGICPPGWHIPTNVEFQTLSSAVGGDGNALKAVGQGTGGGAGTNTSGFSALLAGIRDFDVGGFYDLGYGAYFWSSTEHGAPYASALRLSYDNSNVSDGSSYYEAYGFSVRCLED